MKRSPGRNRSSVFSRLLRSLFLLTPFFGNAQQSAHDTSLINATIENCIQYAIKHNPDITFAKANEEITDAAIRIKLADWYPQVNLNYNLQHNFQLPTVNFNSQLIHSGSENTSGFQLGASQNIFNRDVLLARRSSGAVRLQASENTSLQSINIAALVGKAFYNIILTMQQLKVTDKDIQRIALSMKDAFARYQVGITDKTDYKRASISLNNAKALQRNGEISLVGKFALLKQLMAYPVDKDIQLVYDTLAMSKDIYLDTLKTVDYNNRIEIQSLQTQKKLQQFGLLYYRWSFLPNVSAFGSYNLSFQNNTFTKIYSQSYPNSFAGITFSLPIFQGGKRMQQIRQAELQVKQFDYSIAALQNRINTQYQQALASYKNSLINFYTLKENMALANEVYNIIQLQYRAGIKTYLEVINSETDLRDAQINYYNALYQVLSSKIDVSQALGSLPY